MTPTCILVAVLNTKKQGDSSIQGDHSPALWTGLKIQGGHCGLRVGFSLLSATLQIANSLVLSVHLSDRLNVPDAIFVSSDSLIITVNQEIGMYEKNSEVLNVKMNTSTSSLDANSKWVWSFLFKN